MLYLSEQGNPNQYLPFTSIEQMAKHQSDAKKKKQAVKRAEYKAARNAKYKQAKNKKLHQKNREAVRSETREVVSKKIDSGIRGRFGLPEDCEVFRVPQFGQRKIREVTRGTVVLVNLAAKKLICVVRFNHEVHWTLPSYM